MRVWLHPSRAPRRPVAERGLQPNTKQRKLIGAQVFERRFRKTGKIARKPLRYAERRQLVIGHPHYGGQRCPRQPPAVLMQKGIVARRLRERVISTLRSCRCAPPRMRIKIQAGVVKHCCEHAVERFDVAVPVSEGHPCQPIQCRTSGRRLCCQCSREGARGGQTDVDPGRSQAISERDSKRGTVDCAEQNGRRRRWDVGAAAT